MSRLNPGDTAPDVVLYSPDGSRVSTSDLWGERPVVLNFFRHFGCIHCKDLLSQLRQENPRVVEAGARVVGVFQGPPDNVGGYCRERDVPFDCLSDTDGVGYRAFGLEQAGVRTWLSPGTVVKGIKLYRHGLTTGLPHPGQDVRQMPGTFVISKGGRVRFAHYNRDPADNPSVEVVLGALGAS